MAFEFERSYIFATNNIDDILVFLASKTTGQPIAIQDRYLDKNIRIRISQNKTTLTKKSGDKSSGYRIEEEYPLDRNTSLILSENTKLTIIKQRYRIFNASKDFKITIDIVQIPMKIAILEIESTIEKAPPTASQIFGKDLTECPLSAWDLFKQKIGICGAPSCGKTETAKTISGILNIRLRANSCYVPEYATSFIQKYDLHPNPLDQFMLWYSQKSRENHAESKANIVVSDCPTFLSYIYMMLSNSNKMDEQFKIHLTKLYKRVLEDIDSYSRIIYLRPCDLVDNNIRFHTDDQIRDVANRIYSFLKWHSIPHMVAEKTDAQKIINSLFYINSISEDEQ